MNDTRTEKAKKELMALNEVKDINEVSYDMDSIRPWQGTFLGVLYSIGFFLLIVLGILLVHFLFNGIETDSNTTVDPTYSVLIKLLPGEEYGFLVILSLILLAFSIFWFYFTRDVFRGKRWTMVYQLITTIPGLISLLLVSLKVVEMGEEPFSNTTLAVSLIIGFFLLYLQIACFNHPFYKKEAPTWQEDGLFSLTITKVFLVLSIFLFVLFLNFSPVELKSSAKVIIFASTLISLGWLILIYFILKGLLERKQWVVITLLVLLFIENIVLLLVITIPDSSVQFGTIDWLNYGLSFAFNLYLAIFCLRHPAFKNQNPVIS